MIVIAICKLKFGKACMKACYQRSVIQNCGCGDTLYPSQESAFQKDHEASVVPCSNESQGNLLTKRHKR